MKFKMIPIMFLLLLVTSIYINVTSASTKVPDELPIAKVSPRGSTKLRENYTIEITLTNPNEEDKVDIWKCWAEIDTEKIPEEELQYIEIIKGREEITNFESGDEVTLELIIKFKDDAPEGEYVIPLRVSGKWIVCSSGCVPFQPQNVETKVTLTVLKPVITVYLEDEFSVKGGGKLEIPFSIKNIGTAKALNMSVNYVVDDELLEDLESPSISQELNASAIVDEKLYLDTENIAYGDYSLAIHVEYFTIKNERKVFDKRCDIHILGPTEEEINQEKLDRASTRERKRGLF